MAAKTSTITPSDRIVIPCGGLEQNNTNPIRLKIIPSVPITGCLPRLEAIFQKGFFRLTCIGIFPKSFFLARNFGFGGGGTFPNGGRPQFLQNLLSAVFSVPQWLQYGMDAIPSKVKFIPHETTRAQVL
jgi:hypothetical protein